ncbi:MAG: hypothetical protein EON58_11765, partial [Alphaproteobacteria bacterium]
MILNTPISLVRHLFKEEPRRWGQHVVGFGGVRARHRTWAWFFAPILVLLASSLPWPKLASISGLASFLMTLWQVHGAESGLAIVVFVFLLQTADVSRRSVVSILALATDSRILMASAYGLGTTCGIGIALGVSSADTASRLPNLAANGVHTWLLVAFVVAAFVSNVILTLCVLVKSLGYISVGSVVALQRRIIRDQVEEATMIEVRSKVSLTWLVENAKDTKIARWSWDRDESEPTWSIEADGGKTLVDIDVRALGKVGMRRCGPNDEAGVRLYVELGARPDKGATIVDVRGTPSWRDRLIVRRALRWRRSERSEAESLVSEAKDDFMRAVRDGEIGRFREGMELGVEITQRCLETLDRMGHRGADGIDDLTAIEGVQDMLRFGLDEALKSRRDDFALEVGRGLSSVAEVGFEHANRSAMRAFLRMYPFLRRVILTLGLTSSPIHSELYWRSLQGLGAYRITSMSSRSNDPEFIPVALGVVEETR